MLSLLAPLAALTLATAPTDSGRPLVLVVHGRGQLGRDSAALRRDVLDALRDGARAATGTPLIDERDVRVVWYADLLDSRRAAACTANAAVDAPSGSPLGVIATIAGVLLDAAAGDDTSTPHDSTNALELRGLAGDLRFLADPVTRCAAEQRVGDALAAAWREHRPVVLVAHSLGGLVTWGHLQHAPSPAEDVRRLVTLGSPVGSPDVRRLVFGDDAPLSLPRAVRSWVNVIDDHDGFAASVRTAAADTLGVADVHTESPRDDPHALLGYLRDGATVRAVLGAWCDASSKRPSACATLSP